jgi:hypothetical protein
MIKGPKNAIPTPRGWVSPKGELLKSQRITQEQIDEWNGVVAPEPKPVVEETVELEEIMVEEPEVVEEPVEDAPKKSKRRWGFLKK